MNNRGRITRNPKSRIGKTQFSTLPSTLRLSRSNALLPISISLDGWRLQFSSISPSLPPPWGAVGNEKPKKTTSSATVARRSSPSQTSLFSKQACFPNKANRRQNIQFRRIRAGRNSFWAGVEGEGVIIGK